MTLGYWETPLVDTSVSQNYLLSLLRSSRFFHISLDISPVKQHLILSSVFLKTCTNNFGQQICFPYINPFY